VDVYPENIRDYGITEPSYQIDISPAAQNRLDHLRREAESGQLSVTSFIRRACKVFFTLEEVSRGGIGLLDEKKLDMILCESRRYYPEKATESLVRRTISTYVCQTRGQMRAQESHMQSYPRERYSGLAIQSHPGLNNLAIQQFSPFQANQAKKSAALRIPSPNIHKSINMYAHDNRAKFHHY
jgi:hypothetical protein